LTRDQLKRQLGFRTAAAVVVGEVIAVGIFLTPAGMAKSLGSPALVLAVWLVTGAMALCGALCYGELAARLPEAGGGYAYLREAYGRAAAFLYGWMAFLVMDPGVTAALASGLAAYAGYLLGLSPAGVKLTAVGSIISVAAVNVAGVRAGARLARWLTALKLTLLAALVGWGFASGRGDWSNFAPFVAQRAGSEPHAAALAGAFVAAFFSFGGWWDASKLGGEVREPGRTLARALAAGVVVVTLVYVLTSAVFIYLVPMEAVTSGETFAAQAGERLFGRFGARAFSLVVVVAVLGSLVGLMMAAPRVYYAMARDRLFFRAAARVSPRTGTPAVAIVLQAALACALALLGSFEEIVAYFIFVVVLFLALTVAALFVLRRRESGGASGKGEGAAGGGVGNRREGGGYRTPGYPFTPLVFLALVAVLLVLLAAGRPRESLLGAAVTAAGLPAYFLIFRRKQLT
jgi:basic amino acid/polyamine antiporter, APA family